VVVERDILVYIFYVLPGAAQLTSIVALVVAGHRAWRIVRVRIQREVLHHGATQER
jgi:hypothetical protein